MLYPCPGKLRKGKKSKRLEIISVPVSGGEFVMANSVVKVLDAANPRRRLLCKSSLLRCQSSQQLNYCGCCDTT